MRRRPLGLLFGAIALGFGAIGLYAALEGGLAWIVAVTAAALAVWMGELAYRALR